MDADGGKLVSPELRLRPLLSAAACAGFGDTARVSPELRLRPLLSALRAEPGVRLVLVSPELRLRPLLSGRRPCRNAGRGQGVAGAQAPAFVERG